MSETQENKGYISFVCSSCKQEIEASADMAGQVAECPACGVKLVVPSKSQQSSAENVAAKSRTIRIELN